MFDTSTWMPMVTAHISILRRLATVDVSPEQVLTFVSRSFAYFKLQLDGEHRTMRTIQSHFLWCVCLHLYIVTCVNVFEVSQFTFSQQTVGFLETHLGVRLSQSRVDGARGLVDCSLFCGRDHSCVGVSVDTGTCYTHYVPSSALNSSTSLLSNENCAITTVYGMTSQQLVSVLTTGWDLRVPDAPRIVLKVNLSTAQQSISGQIFSSMVQVTLFESYAALSILV